MVGPHDARSLQAQLNDLDGDWPSEPEALLLALEAAAKIQPAHPQLRAALMVCWGQLSASEGLPPVVVGVHRELLVRWDHWTTTWDGVDAQTGRPARVRLLRPWAAREPVLRRQLRRDGLALGVLLDITLHDEALVLSLPGPQLRAEVAIQGGDAPILRPPLSQVPHNYPAGPHPLARLLGAALVDLCRWEALGLCPPALLPCDLRHTSAGAQVIALSPAGIPDMAAVLRALGAQLQAWWGHEPEASIERVVAGLSALPPASAIEASALLQAALAEDLAIQRHALQERWLHNAQQRRKDRLASAIQRLLQAMPPPHGRGAVGVDLEGAVTLLSCDGDQMRWGPTNQAKRVWSQAEGFDAPSARRALRARAAAPANPRLDQQVGGDGAFTEAACRWIAAGLRLRTLGLLLAKTQHAWPIP